MSVHGADAGGHSVAIVALDDGDRVVLVRRFRQRGPAIWGLPGGLLDRPGEQPREAARRRLEAQTALIATAWRRLLIMQPDPGADGERVHLFVATGLKVSAEPAGDGDEAIKEVLVVPVADAIHMVAEGGIANGVPIAALLATRQWLAELEAAAR
jgi:8-oxo-dGDP phosphatase